MQHLRRMTRGDAAPRDAKTIEELQVTIQSLTDRIAALELQLEQRKSPQGDNEEEGCLINPPALDRRHIAVRRFPSYTAHAMRGALQSVVEGIPMTATRVVTNHLVLVSEANGLGTSTGGQVLSWVDICAGLAAKMLARSPCVTASVDSVHFLRPCRLGSVVLVAAMVNRVFQSSMEVGVRVEEEDVATGQRHHCCSAYLTFVNLRAQQTKGALPRVVPDSPHHHTVYEQALTRREHRLQAKQRAREAKADGEPNSGALPMLLPVTHEEAAPSIPPLAPPPSPAAGPRGIPPCYTRAYMTQLIMPQHANSLGITFGGQVMKWMEQCAYISGSRVSRGAHLVTASMDSIAFSNPTKVGDVLYVTAQVSAIFGSSLEVMISVHGESPHQGAMFKCGDAFATIVSVDARGDPVEVPFALEPSTEAEAACMEAASRRREERLQLRCTLQELRSQRSSLDGAPVGNMAYVHDRLLSMLVNGSPKGSSSLAPQQPSREGSL